MDVDGRYRQHLNREKPSSLEETTKRQAKDKVAKTMIPAQNAKMLGKYVCSSRT